MSKSPVRKDKTCLNCSYVVDNRYCPNCGQENIETRKTFYQLFVHFFEDLTHYENAFWKTIRNLLFRPGSLTKVYLSGKRMSYLAPIRLYIFISFVTFFVAAMLPDDKDETNVQLSPAKNGISIAKSADTLSTKKDSSDTPEADDDFTPFGLTERELDSVQQFGKEEDQIPDRMYRGMKKFFAVKKKYTDEELKEKIRESLWHNYPKALFIYMPMFAFVLWVFQSKRRWYYFDHGIFTLHYFSFLLLIYLVTNLILCLLGLFGDFWPTTLLSGLIGFVSLCYAFYYFFPAHHRFYEETRAMTILKGGCMFFINMFLAGILMLALLIYTFLNIH